jgi:hypothetical protein
MSIHFPILRSKRLTVQLKELTIAQSISLAKMPSHAEQETITAFLKAAIESTNNLDDVTQWTVAERTLTVCHYLSSVVDDGPDFAVGESGHYTDYLDGEHDCNDIDALIDLGELSGDFWQIRHLTGYAAESIERLEGALDNITGRLHWMLGVMAAQLVRKGEDCPANFEEDWLLHRMKTLAALSESDFITLSFLHQTGLDKIYHLFSINYDDDGLLVLPTQGEDLPPARFRVRSSLSGFAQRMGRVTD